MCKNLNGKEFQPTSFDAVVGRFPIKYAEFVFF